MLCTDYGSYLLRRVATAALVGKACPCQEAEGGLRGDLALNEQQAAVAKQERSAGAPHRYNNCCVHATCNPCGQALKTTRKLCFPCMHLQGSLAAGEDEEGLSLHQAAVVAVAQLPLHV